MPLKEHRVPMQVVRAALLKVMPRGGEPATTRELATAVYHHTGNDRVSSGGVGAALKALAADGLVERVDGGWRVAPS